ncbi:hypothetical protein Bca4012_094093 [Brassica carinata]
MSQLLSSPLMAASYSPFTSPRFLSSSSSVLVAGGGLAVKRHGLASKPVNLSVKSRQTDYFEKQRFGDSSSSSQNGEGGPARFYVGHSIYKGKAALTVEPRAPEFVSLDVFSLSVSEIGTLVSLGPRESCEFFHDPNKGKRAEFTVLVSAFNFVLPYLIGWHAFANSIKPEEANRTSNASPNYGGDYEWNR